MSATANDKAAMQQPGCTAKRKSRLGARKVFVAALVVAGGALYFGWSALVAAGIASIIIGVLPCLALCALGLCLGRIGNKDVAAPMSASLPPDSEQSARQPQSKIPT